MLATLTNRLCDACSLLLTSHNHCFTTTLTALQHPPSLMVWKWLITTQCVFHWISEKNPDKLILTHNFLSWDSNTQSLRHHAILKKNKTNQAASVFWGKLKLWGNGAPREWTRRDALSHGEKPLETGCVFFWGGHNGSDIGCWTLKLKVEIFVMHMNNHFEAVDSAQSNNTQASSIQQTPTLAYSQLQLRLRLGCK